MFVAACNRTTVRVFCSLFKPRDLEILIVDVMYLGIEAFSFLNPGVSV